MIAHDLKQIIRDQIASEVSFRGFDDGRLGVSLPLTFGDGDACEVVVEECEDGSCTISDDGYVLSLGRMQGISLLSAGYAARFRALAAFYGAEEHSGELRLTAKVGELGDGLFTFSQACLELARLMEQRPDAKAKKRVFAKQFVKVVEASLPKDRFAKHWHDPVRDPNGIYAVDYHVESANQNWLIFGAGSPSKCWKAASSVQHYKLTKLPLQTVFAYSESAARDGTAFAAMADNANHLFALETERPKLADFLRSQVKAA